MNVRYLTADSLMCLLLPKRAILLPWRKQPNVMFAYTYEEWVTFASRQKNGQFLEYRKILQLPREQQMQYYYADACMSQLYEIGFSGEQATNVIATGTVFSKDKILAELSNVDLSCINEVARIVGCASPYKQPVKLPSALSTRCLLYCYEMSLKGDLDVWKNK